MSARGNATRSQDVAAQGIVSSDPIRPKKPSRRKVTSPSRLRTSDAKLRNGDVAFDPEAFLARAGLGRRVVNLKKTEAPYSGATWPTRFFPCSLALCL